MARHVSTLATQGSCHFDELAMRYRIANSYVDQGRFNLSRLLRLGSALSLAQVIVEVDGDLSSWGDCEKNHPG